MACSTPKRARVSVLVIACVLLAAPPLLAETVTLTFSGEITEVSQTPPVPFQEAAVGDPWSLSYTFESGVVDLDASPTAGNYPGRSRI